MEPRFTFNARLKSFKYAFKGIWTLLKTQHNARIHLLAMICVVGCAAFFRVSAVEWCVLILLFATVFATEALNTAVEFLADFSTAEFHPLVEKAKDIAAAAVLIVAIGAVIIGIIIFFPYFKVLLLR